jgi:hypothetical protein
VDLDFLDSYLTVLSKGQSLFDSTKIVYSRLWM